MVLRHFCNDLILRDCEIPVFILFIRYILYYTLYNISYIILYAIYFILYFIRYILYYTLYDTLILYFLYEKPVLYEGFGYRVYIEVSVSRRAYQVKYSLGGSIN